ncbi:MAG TPA: NAD(P)-dependent oxidoreductase [Thermomicrobiales bacterium]|nr:NAD(P)-dependent oxidoreductase [Thermomicrobiales bacterium]
MTGDAANGVTRRLRRYLPLEITTDPPTGADVFAAVVIGQNLHDDVIENARCELIILVDPGSEDRDSAMRRLAGVERPRLRIVEHAGAEIQAERTWTILLSLLGELPASTYSVRSQDAPRSDLVVGPPTGGSWLKVRPPVSPHGLTLGFIGFRPMAWRMSIWAQAMDMRVVYAALDFNSENAIDQEPAALKSGAVNLPLADVLSTSDVLVLDVGYTDASIRLLDSAEFALVPPGAYLVNTAHGRAIDEGALIQALRDGRFAGVALDRFNYEPLPDDSPLRQFDEVMLTPGIAAPDNDAILERMAQRVAALVSDVDSDIVVRRVRRARPRRVSGRQG